MFKTGLVTLPDTLGRDDALFLLSEVDKWRQQIEMLKSENNELRQSQLQRETQERNHNLKVP